MMVFNTGCPVKRRVFALFCVGHTAAQKVCFFSCEKNKEEPVCSFFTFQRSFPEDTYHKRRYVGYTRLKRNGTFHTVKIEEAAINYVFVICFHVDSMHEVNGLREAIKQNGTRLMS